MVRIRSCATRLALIALTTAALYAAYFTSHLKIGNEHVLLSRAAALAPFSGSVGETVVCTYGHFWGVDCSGPERAASLNLSIRYLCPVFHETKHFECIDRNMVGVAAILTALAVAIAATAAARQSWRSRNRTTSILAILRYGGCGAVSLLLLWQLAGITRPTIWIGRLDEQMIATRPILAFTGNVIGYGLLIGLAAVAIAGAGAAALALTRR